MSSNAPDFKQFKLALIQLGIPSHLAENPTETDIKHANLKHARDMIDRAVKSPAGKPDLVVLPVRRFRLFRLPPASRATPGML
jgi:omega-amidase